MSKVTAWAYTDDNGRTWGFDNSPGSGFADNGPFENINWAAGTFEVTGSSVPTLQYGTIPPGELYRGIVQQNGHTYVGEIFSNENGRSVFSGPPLDVYIERITYAIDGWKIFEIILQDPNKTTYMPESVYNSYAGVSGSEDYFISLMFSLGDNFWGSSADDKIYGYAGDDLISGRAGDDWLVGGAGNDTLYGDDGDDTLIPGPGRNNINAGFGDDEIWLTAGSRNTIYARAGIDTVILPNKISDYVISKRPGGENDILSGAITIYDEDGSNFAYLVGDYRSTSSETEYIAFEYGNGPTISTDPITYTGKFTDVELGSVFPLYRFYNTRDKAFFYTSSEDEKDLVLFNSHNDRPDTDEWPYVYQGATFEAAHSYLNSTTLAPVFRFYNYETGHHFFTTSEAELHMIVGKIASGEWPFNYEGTRFSVYSGDPTPNFQGDEIAVHRFYSPTLNRHFFSADTQEVNLIQLTGIWNYEGIAFWGEDLG